LKKKNVALEKDIEKLLLAMAVNEFINDSSALCGVVNHEVSNTVSNVESRGVKQAKLLCP